MRCFHAASGLPTCGQEAIVLASESGRILRQNLPLCGECAQRYASQAAGYAMQPLAHDLPMNSPLTITLRPLKDDR
jgi:hypothetical protein